MYIRSYSLTIALAALCFAGCQDARDWSICNAENTDCLSGYRCDLTTNRCVPAGDGGPHDTLPPTGTDASAEIAGTDVGLGEPDAPAGDTGGVDRLATPDAGGPDHPTVPDAAGTCTMASDCTDPAKPFCAGNVCAGCQTDAQCIAKDPALPACAPSGLCVQCTSTSSAACTRGTPICDPVSNTCVQCVSAATCSGVTPICATTDKCKACATDAECASLGSPARAACAATGACVECTAANLASCTTAKPVCDGATNTCVQCTSSANCSGKTPICGASEKCQPCSGDADCAALGDSHRTACAASGACVQCTATNSSKCIDTTSICNTTTNACVQCLTNATCSGKTPICATETSACRGCTGASDCAAFPGRTACAASGACVQCTDNGTCSGTTPICGTTTNTCRACAADSECAGTGPGVCMADGHCATESEVIYVGTSGTATCSESNAGTALAPVCSLYNGVSLAKTNTKGVVIVRGALAAGSTTINTSSQLTIVGRSGANVSPAFAGADAITITSGDIYLRNLTIQGSTSPKTGIGINANPGTGSTVALHIDTCAVINNPGGGILLNGAAFEIKNTTVTGNGPGTSTVGATYGGIRVESPPASGSTSLTLTSIKNNNQVGLSCAGAITGTGVLASGNVGSVDIGTTCAITACPSATTTCGAQATPQ